MAKGSEIMANIFNTAKYILDNLGELSTMKLQKLCYYSQAWSLVWDDKPLFSEDFQAWKNGPVCYELFKAFQGNFSVTSSDIKPSMTAFPELTDNQKNTIDEVLKAYGDKNAQCLSRLTHLEDPWIIARQSASPDDSSVNIVTKESMAMYYGAL